jgi:hypothetical protein
VRIATRLGIFGALLHSLLPKVAQITMNTSFRMFPEERLRKQAELRKAQREAEALARERTEKLGQLVEKFGRNR